MTTPAGAQASEDFLQRALPGVNKPVHRLGLALNYGIDAAGVEAAAERGLNYFYVSAARTGAVRPAVRRLLQKDRERFVVAAGPSMGWFGFSVRRGLEKWLRELGTDYLDVLQLPWVGVGSALTGGTLEALLALKAEGKARAIGLSTHDRPRAGKLVEQSPFDSRSGGPRWWRTPRRAGAGCCRPRAAGAARR